MDLSGKFKICWNFDLLEMILLITLLKQKAIDNLNLLSESNIFDASYPPIHKS